MTPLLHLTAAASLLSISVRTLRAHVSAGRVAHRRIGGAIRFTESDLAEFVEACRVDVKGPEIRPARVVMPELTRVKMPARPH